MKRSLSRLHQQTHAPSAIASNAPLLSTDMSMYWSPSVRSVTSVRCEIPFRVGMSICRNVPRMSGPADSSSSACPSHERSMLPDWMSPASKIILTVIAFAARVVGNGSTLFYMASEHVTTRSRGNVDEAVDFMVGGRGLEPRTSCL